MATKKLKNRHAKGFWDQVIFTGRRTRARKAALQAGMAGMAAMARTRAAAKAAA